MTKTCSFCGKPALPDCGVYAYDEHGKRMCWDCRNQWVGVCVGDTEVQFTWIQQTWVGLDGKRHGGYPDPRKRATQGKLFGGDNP